MSIQVSQTWSGEPEPEVEMNGPGDVDSDVVWYIEH